MDSMPEAKTVSRRTLVKGAAWAMPAIAVAANAPAMAASPLISYSLGRVCYVPSNKYQEKGDLVFSVTFENKTNQPLTISPNGATVRLGNRTETGAVVYYPSGYRGDTARSVTLPPNGSATVDLRWDAPWKDVPEGNGSVAFSTQISGSNINVTESWPTNFDAPSAC